jgi:hypothetical protein
MLCFSQNKRKNDKQNTSLFHFVFFGIDENKKIKKKAYPFVELSIDSNLCHGLWFVYKDEWKIQGDFLINGKGLSILCIQLEHSTEKKTCIDCYELD